MKPRRLFISPVNFGGAFGTRECVAEDEHKRLQVNDLDYPSLPPFQMGLEMLFSHLESKLGEDEFLILHRRPMKEGYDLQLMAAPIEEGTVPQVFTAADALEEESVWDPELEDYV